MSTESRGPTNRELVAFTKSEGFKDVSERQLRRWREEGLLPDLIPESRGREGGVKRFNPPGTEKQLRVLLRSRERFPRKMMEWAWALWNAGYPVTPQIRAFLLGELGKLEDRAKELLALHEDDPEAFAEFANNLPRGVANFLRGVDEPQVPVYVVLSMAAGEFNRAKIHEGFPSIQQAFHRVGRVLGIEEFKLESEEGGDFLLDIARTVRIAGLRSDLRVMPDSELEELRDFALLIYGLWAGGASNDEPMEPSLFAILLVLQRLFPNLLIPELLRAIDTEPEVAGFAEQLRTFTTTGKLSHQRKKSDDDND